MDEQLWERATILVPAGVEILRMTDNQVRKHPSDLKFHAQREVDDSGPIDDIWHFRWLSKWHQVPQSLVKIISE